MSLKKVFKKATKPFSYATKCKPFDGKVGGYVRYRGKFYNIVIAPLPDNPCVPLTEDQDDKR